jgi:hypothetical protein
MDTKNMKNKFMKVLQLVSLLLFSSLIFAQNGSKSLQISGEAIIPALQEATGFGLSLKGLYGITQTGQLTLSGRFSKYKLKNIDGAKEAIVRLVPFLVGYKQNIRQFFIEPKVGMGELGGKLFLSGGDYSRPSVWAIFGGLEAGLNLKRISLGINFLAINGISNSSAGTWYNKIFHYTSVSVNYILFKKTNQ